MLRDGYRPGGEQKNGYLRKEMSMVRLHLGTRARRSSEAGPADICPRGFNQQMIVIRQQANGEINFNGSIYLNSVRLQRRRSV